MYIIFHSAGIPIESDIKKVVKSIIDTYRKERKKVVDSDTTGMDADDVYVPKLAWYNEADGFLQQAVTIRARINNGSVKPQKVSSYINEWVLILITYRYVVLYVIIQ